MEYGDLSQLISSGKASLAIHALKEWEKDFASHHEPLLQALQLNDPQVLEVALKLAEKYHPAVCAEPIVALLKSADSLTRRLAVQSLIPAMGACAEEGLKMLFVSEQDVFVLASAVTAAARLNVGVEYVTPYFAHQDIRLRANAIRAAAKLGRNQLPGLIEPFLSDPALRVQNEALKGLATLASEAELELLVLERLNSPDAPTRAATVFITGELPLGRRVVFLINALSDKDHRVTGCAVRSLAVLRDPLGIRALIENFLTAPDEIFARSIIKQLEADDADKIVSFADTIGRPVTSTPILAGRVMLAASTLTNWEPFLPWVIGATNRKEPDIRQAALKIIANHMDFFRGNIATLLEKAEASSEPLDVALAALIRWKSGQTDGLNKLQTMIFSLKPAESAAALEVLKNEKGLMARKLLNEAQARGLLGNEPPKAGLTLKLPTR